MITLTQYILSVKDELSLIADERKKLLEPLIKFVQEKVDKQELANLVLICTHNSRRSHLSQVWAQVAARHFGISNVFAYSGGTEATALYPSAAKALEKAGLQVVQLSADNNPVYSVKYDENDSPIIAFSKRYDDSFNPQTGFAAVMTCNNADQNCPIIPGVTRFSLPYEDPKAFDSTSQETEKYEERSRQIAQEMFYLFSKIKK